MEIKVKRFGSTEALRPTILSYGDGLLLEDDLLDWSDLEVRGLVYSRFAHTTDPDSERAEVLRADMAVVPPEEMDSVQAVFADGSPVLVRNLETGKLDAVSDVALRAALEGYVEERKELDEDEDQEGESIEQTDKSDPFKEETNG